MTAPNRTLGLVSTIHGLQSAGMQKVKLLQSKTLRNLLKEQLRLNLKQDYQVRNEELNELAAKAMREFKLLLQEHLANEGITGIVPGNSPGNTGAVFTREEEKTGGLFVIHSEAPAEADSSEAGLTPLSNGEA